MSKPRYKIMVRRAKMPGSCYGPQNYHKIGVVELGPEWDGTAREISDRTKGVVRVVETWDRLYKGKTEKCAFGRALAEAEALIAQLEG